MQTLYSIVIGPLAWIAFGVFFLGLIGKAVYLICLSRSRDTEILHYFQLRYGLRSILHWLIPFGTRSWRQDPLMTLVTFIFHLCLIIVPVFLGAHVILWDYYWQVSYWSLPNIVADVMTILVIVSCIYFAIRRATLKQVRFVTSYRDWLILIAVFTPFMSGFFAYHQIFDYQLMTLLHIFSGEILLIIIPFSRLNHILYAPLIRAYIGSEFGGIRKARDW